MTQDVTTPAEQSGNDGGHGELKRVMGPGLLLLFIVGDILGAGVYAVTGNLVKQVGGVAWLPFLVAFAVATVTAYSYLELVTKYPQAAGAALYTHKAFGLHFVTFLVAFTVMCSGITSASTSARLLASNLLLGFGEDSPGKGAVLVVALGFMVVLALINLRGVGESVKFNVVLTLVEMLALAIVIVIGLVTIGRGEGDVSRITVFENADDRGLFMAVTVATAIAFFSMVGFEDSVNMVEETKNPLKVFPKVMFTGLGIAVVIYMLVAISVVAVIPHEVIVGGQTSETGVLIDVVKHGAPGLPIDDIFPFLTVFAVANTALLNMLMASRLIYGMARQDVLPRSLSKVLPGRQSPWAAIVFTTTLAFVLIIVVGQLSDNSVTALSGTTATLLLAVFSIVNVACLVLRREPTPPGAFRAPTLLPVVGAAACLFLLGPWARLSDQMIQYKVAAGMLAVGVVLWALTWAFNRSVRSQKTGFRDIDHLE